jgi:hypothetical protein
MWHSCMVCGTVFWAKRFDARMCTDTCRQRLRRGGDLAYMGGMNQRERDKARRRARPSAVGIIRNFGQHQRMLCDVARVVTLFAKQGRPIDAGEMATTISTPAYTVEIVAELIAELKANGDFDRIMAWF